MAAKKSPFFDTATTLGKIVAFFGVSALCGVLAAGLMVPVASLAGSGANAGVDIFNALPASFAGEPIAEPSKILAKDGSTIATFYSENRQPVKLKNISPVMRKAIVSIEDERFYQHNGVDMRGIARAAVNNFTSSSQQGASTLTQQYVNNLLINSDSVNGVDRSEMTISGTKNIADKAREAKLAISIEKEMSKDEILEGYLNLVLFSGRNYGVQAAAQRFYSIDAKDLNLQQSAMLAGMVQLPNAYNPESYPERSIKRRNTVLAAMLRTGAIDKAEYKKAVASDLNLKPHKTLSGCIAADSAAYFCDYVTKLIVSDDAFGKTAEARESLLYRGGLTIKTTLDPKLQKEAEKQSKAIIPADDKSNIGASIVTVEPGSGNILAMGQNKTYSPAEGKEFTEYNFAVESSKGGAGGFQGGSTMKPYTTLAWLQAGNTMSERISAPQKKNYPASFRWKASCLPAGYTTVVGEDGKGWSPANAVDSWASSGTVDYGLFNSINSFTVSEASRLDLCDISANTEKLGLVDYENYTDLATGKKTTTAQPISPANPSFVIGSAQITPLAQATAFATFANNGEYCENRALTSVTDASGNEYKVKPVTCSQELSPKVVSDLNGTLKKIASQKVAKGAINYQIAGKTGTNNGATSTWFVGYTSGMSSAAWVGRWDKQRFLATKNQEIAGVSRSWVDSGTWASPLWVNYMKEVGDLYSTDSLGKASFSPQSTPSSTSVESDSTTEAEAPATTAPSPTTAPSTSAPSSDAPSNSAPASSAPSTSESSDTGNNSNGNSNGNGNGNGNNNSTDAKSDD